MAAIAQYVFSVIATAIFCGLIQLLFDNDTGMASLMKFITGLVMTIAVISPILNSNFTILEEYMESIQVMRSDVVWEGESMARNAVQDIIKQEAEAYILDRATALDAAVTVQVTLSEDDPPVPVSATVTGEVSPYVKKQLSEVMQEELGISKEQQIWS